jgi:hypothetical protein
MSEQSYKILAAKRLAIDPNELLMYFEFHDHVLVTTPDGHQHKFTFAELDRPRANDVAENGKIAGDPAPAAGARRTKPTKKVAKTKNLK